MTDKMKITGSGLKERILWIRETSGCSARELSRLSGLAESHWSQLESGTAPSIKTLSFIQAATSCDLKWLAFGIGSRPTKKALADALTQARNDLRSNDLGGAECVAS